MQNQKDNPDFLLGHNNCIQHWLVLKTINYLLLYLNVFNLLQTYSIMYYQIKDTIYDKINYDNILRFCTFTQQFARQFVIQMANRPCSYSHVISKQLHKCCLLIGHENTFKFSGFPPASIVIFLPMAAVSY